MREIVFVRDRCLHCGACSAACVAEHVRNHPLYDRLASLPMGRKRAVTAEENSPDNPLPYPARCMHCADVPCRDACISGAIGKDDRVFSRWERCVGCFMCVMNCPYGAVIAGEGKALKCDECLFTAGPACVRACPQGALLFREEDHPPVSPGLWKERTRRDIPLLRAKR